MMTTRSIAHRSGAIPFRLFFPLAFFNVFGWSKYQRLVVGNWLSPIVRRVLALVFFFSVSFLGFGQNYSLNYSGDETVFTNGNVPASVVGSNARTIEFWIKPALNNANYKYIFNIGPTSATNFFAVYYRNGNVIFNNYQTDITIGAVATSTWHHVAIVFDGASTISTYLDGVAGGSGGAAVNTTQTVLSMGALNYNGTAEQWFVGQIDEFRIWDVARDITAINATKDVSLVGNESNLVAYYDFNDGTGSSSVTDLAGGNNVTTISGINTSTDWMTGAPIDPNYALDFDGVSHMVTTTGNAPINGASPRTLEFLYKPFSNSGLQFPISYGTKAGGTYFGVQNNAGQLVFNGYAADLATGFTFTTGTWYHIAITFDGTTVNMYVDGNPTPTPSANLTLNTTATAIVFGGTTDGERITGQLDEVRLWDYAKSQAQIAAFKDQELDAVSPPPGLVSYYDFSDGPNSSILTDQIGGNNANLTGMDAANDWVFADHGIAGSGTLDATAPTVVISTLETNPTSATPFQITITFDEEVAGFTLSDLTVGNGTASNLSTIDNIVYTADITGSTEDSVTVDIVAGVVTDLTGNGNVASSQFSIYYQFPNEAISFNNSAYVNLGNDVSLNPGAGDFTWEAYIKPTGSFEVYDDIISKHNGGSTPILMLNSGNLAWYNGSVQTSASGISLNTWHHVAVTRTGGIIQLYLDGSPVGTPYDDGSVDLTNTVQLRIGAQGDGGGGPGNPFNGLIDEVAIWNVARSGMQIADSYLNSLNGTENGLVAYFNGALDGADLDDLVGSQNGIMVGATIVNDELPVAFNSVPLSPSITVVSPNGGEIFTEGDTETITWSEQSVASTDNISIDLDIDGLGTYTINLASGAASTFNGSFDWTVTSDHSSQSRIKVSNITKGVDDISDADFTIQAVPNYALSFDGANDRVELTRTQVTGGLTYEAWIKPAASVGVSGYDGSSGMTIIGDMNNDVGFSFGLTNSQLEMHHFNGSWQSVIGSTTLAIDGTWYHVALTHDQSSGDVALYLNGAVEQTGNIPWNVNATYHSFNRIGSSYTTGATEGDFFQGEIDEVRIWNDVRTAAEISANYLNEVTGSEPNLISYYDFSDGSGSTLTDKSITGNDGIISGAVWTGTGPSLGAVDVTAPTFNSTPTITGVDDNDATLTVQLNETGQVHWGVYTQANILSAEDVKNGVGTGGVIFGALNVPTANLDAVQLINSLAPSTSYYLYIAPEDGSGNFGAPIEAQFTTDPAPENAMAFDGSSGYVNLPSGFESIITQNFTVEAWINPNSIDRYAAIVDHMEWTGGSLSGYLLTLHETGELVARLYTGTDVVNDVKTPISAGSWQHVAMTYDGVQLKLYLNGNLEDSTSASGLIDYNPVPPSHNIGRFHDSNEEYFFNGQIDEVRIWDVARTQGQIQSAFSTSLTSGSGLIASYVFNQSSYTLLDQTINGHNGGLNGGVSYVPSTALSTDITAPVLTNLAFDNIGSTNVDLLFESDEESDLYYVFTQSATPPSAQQIIVGENELGTTATDHAGTFESASAGSHDFGIGDNPASLPELIPNTQYYVYIVAEDSSGNRSAILSGDFTTSPLPVDLTFTTLSVAGTTLEQGSSDNLIYKVQMDVSGGTATMIGMFFSPTGTYTSSDITQFNYYHSIGVDDFENAVHLLSRGFFSGEAPAPDGALGLFFDSVYTDTTVYWYVTVDISATATGGNTLGIAAPSVGGNFGINESSNKIDGGLAASGTYTITAPPENALDFGGSSDIVSIPHDATLRPGNQITIEFWMNTSDLSGNHTLYRKEDGSDRHLIFFEGASNFLTWGLGTSNGYLELDQTVDLTDYQNQWVHIAAVYDGTDKILYRNGTEIGRQATTGTLVTSGSAAVLLGSGYNGQMDDLRVWDYARSKSQILGNLTTKIKSATGLVASYDFNIDAGTVLTDLSGNGNDGVLTNFDFSGTSSDWIASTVPLCAPNGKFIGATDSNWNDPSNWCGGVVPAANNVAEDIVVSINSDITENQDLVLNANDFQVASGASLVLNLNSNSVQLTNNATFTNNGTVSVSNGTGVNATAGSFINNGVFFFEAGTQLASPTGTFVNNGILKGFFTVTNDFTNPVAGTVAPGASPGCANFVSDFTNAGTLEVEIDGTNPCSQYDQITVGGTANLAGTLNVTLGFTPISGNEFVIIDAAAISGTFTTVNLPDANWSIAYDFPGTGQVSLTYIDPSEMIGSTGPGGVGSTDGTSPLQLWVKADAGTNTTVDAGAITTWSDQSGYGRTMTNGTSPTYQGNVINGQPVVRFNAASSQYMQAVGFTDNFTSSGFTIFTVAQWTGSGAQGYVGFKSRTGLGTNNGTTFFLDDVNGSPTDLRISSPSSGALGNNQWSADNRSPRLLSFTRSTSLLNGYDGGTNVVSNVNEGAIYDGTQPWMIGRYNNDNLLYFTGDVAEFILFEGVLNTASRTVVENHLSAKYDIAHTMDLYAGDTGPNGDFDFDVIGIGKEADGSDPEGSAQGLTLTNAGFLQDNGDYIFAGHDGTAHAIVQSDLPVGYANRWARSWYVDVTDSTTMGTGGLATLTFDFDEAGLGLPNANLALITRPGTSGSYAVASTDFLIAGNKVSFTLDASAIIDGHTYTIADDFVPNNALLFDGVAGNYVQGPSLAGQITNDFTFETWFRTTASDHRMMIALGDHLGGAGAQAQLKVNANSVMFGVNAVSSVVSPSATYTDGSWHHAAGVYSGTLLTLYLDGELIDTTSAALSMDLSAFKIGDHSGGNLVWDGELDNMRIWNVARTQSEIIANAYNTLLSDTTLVVSYDFNSSSGTTLFDGTANGLDGTLVGTPPAWVSSTAWDIDIFAPIFEAGYPTITNINENDFDLTVQLNEEGTVYYVVLPDSAAVPSNDDIKAGTDGLGGAAVVASNFPVNLIGSEVIANITGLSEGTSYDVYLLAEDDEGAPNTQKMATVFDITTLVFPENALSFDGTDDYVEVAANAAFEFSSGTIEAWIKPASNTENKVIAGVRSSDTQTRWSIHVNAGNDYFLIWNGSGSATVPVPIEPGTWYHVAFNISGSDTEVFVNGVSYGFAGIGMSALTGEPLLIGSPGSTQPSEFFEGEMDELRIWNTHRTQSEILNNMNLSQATGSGLVASYDFNTGLPGGNNTGLNTLTDISGNGYDGTLNAFALVGDTSNWVASEAFAPIIYQVSAANLNNLSVNWQPTNRGQVYVDINDASNFAGVPYATGHQIGNGSNSTSIVTGLSLSPNTRYFARIYYQDGGFTSPYSDTVEFMINAGSALNFDGTNDFVVANETEGTFNNLTISAWVRPTSLAASQWIYWRGNTGSLDGAELYITNTGQLVYGESDGTYEAATSAGSLPVSQWSHVAATKSGTNVQLYINGVPDGNNAAVSGVPPSGHFAIGARHRTTTGNYFVGDIDEVSIWNIARSQAEIQATINNTLGGNENGLVAYYRFDEGDTAAVNTGITAPEIIDLSGNGNVGTMSGFAKTGATSNWVASGAFTLDNNTAPLAPTEVIAFSSSLNNITLQWKDNSYNETGYLIENADDYDFTLNVDTIVADLGVNATSFVHSAGADQGYFYRVTPVNGSETVASTSEVEFATTKSFPGYALSFDGIADSVDMGSTGDLQISGALTYEVWIKTTQTQGFIFGKRNGNNLGDLASSIELDGTGKIQGLVYDGSAGFPDVIQSNTAVNDGEWHHVAFVFEPAVALRLYIDGALDKTFGISSTNINGASYPFRVGKYPTSSSAFFDGEMDEIRVWNDVRSDAEISDNLYHDLKGNESNLVAYYPMDENSGTKLVDRSVNTNNGDIGGAGFILSDVPLGPPMNLLSSIPSVNETNIARGANIQMTFDANVDAATLTGNIVVMGSHSGITAGTFTGGGTSVITFDPDEDFLAGEYISATITENVRGLDGEVAVPYNLQFAVATGPFQGAFVEQTTGLEGVVDGAAAWADYDGDGDLDIVVSGWDFDYTLVITKIFNNSAGSFIFGDSLTGVYEGSLDWGDYDSDGDLDLFVTGFDDGGSRTAMLYQNNAGTFTDVGGPFQGVAFSEADWGDFDNDGDLDLIVQGQYDPSNNASTIVYRNDAGTFVNHTAGLVGVYKGDVAWGDYDNDGDLDIVSSGYTSNNDSIRTIIYENDGGLFTDIGAVLEGKVLGSVGWGDYDNDGDLDLMVSGSNTDSTPIIYRNDAGSFVDIAAGLLENSEGEMAWGDYDGDGDLDLVINGSGTTNSPTTTLYTNNAGTFVITDLGLRDYLYSTVDWGDYDNDGDLDLLLTGTDDYNGGRVALFSNALAPPTVLNPTNVSTAGFTPNLIAPSGAVDLIVDVSSDSTFGSFLSQNVSVGTSGGVDITVALTAGTEYFYRAKTDFGGGVESSYYQSNGFMVQPGNALPFTGNDYVEVFDNLVLEPTGDFTIEFWFNTDVIGNVVFLEKGVSDAEYSVQQSPGNKLGIYVNGGWMETNLSYNDSTWHHAAFVYRGPGDGTIYVDGVEDVNAGSVATLGTPAYSFGRLTFGDRRFGGSFNIEGLMDEVRIWDDERTFSEINDNRFYTLAGDEQGLIAYYQFDEIVNSTNLSNLSTNKFLDGELWNMDGSEWISSGALGAVGTVVSITADEANPAGSAIASELDWNIQFTSPVTGLTPGNFTLNSSGIGGGSSISSVTDVDGFNWTVTATVDTGDGTIGVDFTNDTGLNATMTNAPFVGEVYTIDRTEPTTTLTSSEPDPSNSGSFTVDITFSEGVTGLGLGSVSVGNGIASNLIDIDGISYTVDIAPSTDGVVSVDLVAGAAQDIAGNDNSAASTFYINYDATSPTPVISSLEPDPTNSSPFIVNIDFTEPVTGFDLTDVSVTNGAKANLVETLNYAYDSQFGSAGSADGQFNDPYGIVEDGSGDIWVADRLNNRLQEFDPAGNFMQSISFSAPIGLAVDGSDNLYVTRTNNLVYKIDQSGAALLTIGTSGSGAGQFANPSDVAIDHSTGDIYVTDYNNAKFLKYNSAGDFQWEVGSNGSGDGQFNYPTGVVVSGSTVYVTDDNNNRVQAFDTSGNFQFVLGSPGTGDGQLQGVDKIDVDGAGNVYVLDRNNHRFQVFTSGGNYMSQFGSGIGSADGQFNFPRGIAVSASGDVLISDGGNNRIQRIKGGPSGNFSFELTPSADGSITVDVGGGAATDLAGNVNNSATQFSITADSQGPDVTIDQSGAQSDPTNGTIVYDVIFSEPISGFTDDTNVDFASSTVGGTLSGSVSEVAPFDGTTYTLTVSGMTGTGDVVVNIQGGAATDLAGNFNSVSTSTDNTVTYDDVPPGLTITTPIASDNYVNSAEASSVVISGTSDAEDGRTVTLTIFDGSTTLNPSAVVSGSSWSVPVDFSSLADGNVTITADVTDLAGNAATSVNVNVTLDQTDPNISGNNTPSTIENTTSVGTYTADESVTWSLSGTDASAFSITSGVLTFVSAPDFESPSDGGSNNIYDVIVTGTDGAGNVGILAVSVTVTDADEINPVISGNSSPSIQENTTSVGTYTADESVTWSLSGTDASEFSITSGVLTFVSAPDFESPTDGGADNVYDLIVTGTDGAGNVGTLAVSVTVNDEDEIAPIISGLASVNVLENTTIVGNYTADEAVTWSLSGDDASLFTIDGSGNVDFVSAPDFETPSDLNSDNIYDIVIEGTDGNFNVGTLAVSVTVDDEDEIAPIISGLASVNVLENTTIVGSYTADEAVTWSLSGDDASLFTIDGSGNVDFVSAPDFETPSDLNSDNIYDIVIEGTDGNFNVGTLAVSVTVDDEDEIAPIISGLASVNMSENTTIVGNYTADEAVTWSLSGDDASLFTIDGSGNVDFVSAPDFETPSDLNSDNIYDIVIEGTDGNFNVGTLAVSVTVTDADEINPVISGNGTPSVQENTTSVGTYTADESVTWSLSGTDASAFSITSGVLTFVSAPDFESPSDGGSNNVYDVIVTGTDGSGNVGTLAVSVTVTDADEINPVISGNGTPSVQENTTSVGTYTADESVTWSLSGTDASAFSITSGVLTFVSAPDFESPSDGGSNNVYDVIVTGTDGSGNVGTLAVSVTVTDLDEINPVISGNGTPSVQENTTSVGTYTADESVTWSLSGTDASAFSITSGVLTFVSAPDFESPGDGGSNNVYDVIVTGTDGAGNVGTLAVSVTVTDADEINPVISGNGTPSVQENTTSVGNYTADESVTWSLSGTDASAFSITSGVLTFVSAPDFESPTDGGANNVYDVTVTGTDGAGNVGILAVSVTVTDADEINPVISGNGTPSVQENTTSVGTYTADESVTWSLSGTDPSAFSITSGVLTFLSSPDFESPGDGGANNVYDVIVTGTDGAGNVGTLAVSVTVTDADEINPVISGNGTPSVQENTTSVGTYAADESVTWSLSGTDASAFSITSGALTFLSAPDFESPSDGGANNIYDVIVTGTDGSGNVGTLAVSVTVTDLDEIDPAISGENLPELIEGETLVGTYTADESVTWGLAGVDASFFTVSTGGELSFVSAPDFDSPLDAGGDNIYDVTLQGTDAAGNIGSLAVSIKVLQSDVVPPVIAGDELPEIAENTLLVGQYTADEEVSWTLSGEDAGLFTVSTTGELSLNTEADFELPGDADANNIYLLTITATDGQGNFSDLSLMVAITDANDNTPEIVDPGSVSVDENSVVGTLVVGLTATDADTGSAFAWSLGTGNVDVDGDGSAPFVIDATTGELTVNDPDDLDYESGTISFSLQVIVEDGANAQGVTVFIAVNDLDETIAIGFDGLVSNDPSPELTGTVDDPEATIEVSVDGSSYTAINNIDGTWQLAGGLIADLSDGTYEVTITATGLSGGQFGSITGTLVIDGTAPLVSIESLITNVASPELSGTVDDADAAVQVTVNGSNYDAANQGDGSWVLAAGTIASLSEGTYEVTVTATDPATNEGTSTGALEIDISAPAVTVDALETLKDSPALSGTVDDPEAIVEVTVDGSTYEAIVSGTVWTVEEGTIASLAVGTYDVLATASDAAGNSAEDATSDELIIKAGAPTALAATEVDYFSFTANWKARTGVSSYRLDISSDASFVNLLSGFDNLSTTATSVVVTGLNYGSVYHYRVRAVYASGDISGNSNVITVTTPTDAGTLADSLALLSIYEATGGASWTKTNNWKTSLPLREWSDISMTGTRVTLVDLSSNNLAGAFPEISEGLELLATLDLSGNLLTSLPALTSLSGLTSLDVSDNKLGFASLEPNVGVSGIVYSPQKAAGERIETLEQQGTNFTIDRTVTGSSNSYEWFKENLKTNAITELTNTGSSLTIAIESFNDEGGYFVEVTNDLVPGLTIKSEPVVLKVSSLERDFAALQNIYDAMGGESWTGEQSNWPNETDFANWHGVDIQSERVVGLDLDAIDMTGELPNDILDIAGLKEVDLSGNRISKIPNMTSLSLSSLNVSGNNLEFDDLEPNVQIAGINYANQRLVGAAKNDTIVHGSDFTILLEVGGSANAYQWSRANDVGTGPVSGATSNSYTIEGISYETMGVFTLSVTNSKVPGLTLTSRKQRVLATADLTFTALDLSNELFTEGEGYALRVTAPGKPYDTIQAVRGSAAGFVFEDLILGDYLIAVRADDLVEFLPTYYPSTDLWKEAEQYILREDGMETLRMAQIPPPLPPLPDGGVVGGTIESDFADEEEEDEGARIESRRKVKRAGCSMRRFVRSGRIDQEGDFILYAYVESDDEGRFNFKDIEPGLYRFNIEYPGIPMDPDSFVEFEIGADGKERNSFTLEATVTEEGIVVEKINELGFYRKYFKDLNVYPNPSDEVMHVSYAKMLAKGVVMRLVDLKGNVVLEQAVERGYDMALDLDVREIPAGVYLLNFVDTLDRKRSVVTYRVVIRH